MDKTKLTSVKILEHLYKSFKKNTVNTDMTLQKITNRAIDLYLNDEEFRKEVEKHEDLKVSGSKL
tara:strand:- start:333 stop:527 length:195 start_codon:yes stop_codon:yes gene_type:complete